MGETIEIIYNNFFQPKKKTKDFYVGYIAINGT